MGKPTFLDLFAGAGGLSFGLTRAGFEPLLAIDNWPDAVATYAKNLGGHVWQTRIEAVTERTLAQALPARPDWIVGGAPCQGFSTVGKRDHRDERNALVREFGRIVKLLKPEGFLLENVIGLRDMRFPQAVRVLFEKLGYSVSSLLLTSADYGVPQLRRRMVFVGHRDCRFFRGPKPTHGPANYVTVWDAIGDLPALGPGESSERYDKPPETGFQLRMREGSHGLQGHAVSSHPPHLVRAISFIPDGGNRRAIPDRFQPKSGYHNSYSRLYSKAPAVAITSNMGKPSATRCVHPFQHRGLTAREGARLQTFPDRFHFLGGLVSSRLQIANAVPPLLAAAIGRALTSDSRWADAPIRHEPQPLRRNFIPDLPPIRR